MSRRQFSEPLSAVICRQFPCSSTRSRWGLRGPTRLHLTILMRPLSVVFSRLSCRLSVSFSELLYSDHFHYLRGSFRTFRHHLIRYTSSCSWWHWCSVPSWLISAGINVRILAFYFRYRPTSFLRFNMLLPLLLRSLFNCYCARKSISDLLLLRGIYISYMSESERCTGYDDSREQRYCCTVRLTKCLTYFTLQIFVCRWRQEPL